MSNPFDMLLNAANRGVISKQEHRTLRGQALKGDIEGALKGLNKLLKRRGVHEQKRAKG